MSWMAWREADERGWIRLVGNEGNCHLFFSTHCVTPGCYLPLPSCLALALYSSSPPFFCPKAYYIFSCALSLSPSPFTPFSLTPLLCPPFFFSLPPFKAHALLSALAMWSGQREQNNGRLSVSRPSIGGALAASIFLYCPFKQANAASLLLARLATTVD